MNRKVIVTGASRGLGRAIVEYYSQRNVSVVATSRNLSPEFIDWCDTQSSLTGTSVIPAMLDLEDPLVAQKRIQQIMRDHSDVTDLVNNAAYAYGSLFSLTSLSELKRVFDINFFSNMAISQVVAKQFRRNGFGSITNISSQSARNTSRGMLAYGSSKCSLEYATRILAEELTPFGIKVNAIAPGILNTDMSKQMKSEAQDAVLQQTFSRMPTSLTDVAQLIFFISLQASTQITGKVIEIDGGTFS
jgi:3-oxoacyl-[acyl-carrier protein] reductase